MERKDESKEIVKMSLKYTITPKENLNNLFEKAKRENANYIYVVVRMNGFKGDELIINPKENIDSKLSYYNKAYDDNLFLKANKDIRIVGYGWSTDLSDIDETLYYPEFE